MLDRRSPHGMEHTLSFIYRHNENEQVGEIVIYSVHVFHEVNRVARGRHEAFRQCAKTTGRDASEGSGELGGQAAGGGVGQADGGGRAQGLQASNAYDLFQICVLR